MAIQLARAGTVVVFCALEQEAGPLRAWLAGYPQVEIRLCGVGAQAAAQAVARRLQQAPRPALVISAGFCGALRPQLRIGDIVHDAAVESVPFVLATPAQKRQWASHSAAWAVDLESATICRLCQQYQVPCRVIRAVSDRWNETIPAEVLEELAETQPGQSVAVQWIYRLVQRPTLLSDLFRLWRNSRRAARSLARAVERCLVADKSA
ncbi:MAG: hypothetical protein NZ703_03475 [Gemmataceae bacterium]|nr:hypothetical protein [Gemmataceae bacterium]MCS7270125.1 hypothetical protein [Gemmataceae bacterium]MDW8242627.1 hypothetical protein [Thermogemmata sp.]